MKFLICLLLCAATQGSSAKEKDFSVELKLVKSSQKTLRLLVESNNKKCIGSHQNQPLNLGADVCDKVFAKASVFAAERYISSPVTSHEPYYEIRYKSGSKNWSKRVAEVESAPSANQPVRDLILFILKEVGQI